ncbi:MAG: GNAT family N-acetyltransferase [Clostridia bacterium]|nr:GNAT family N-acetyltransferase [Clostridia bacterium]MBQ2709753.1 GNAT family N-acetyltransferase [Clostridia bacterium]
MIEFYKPGLDELWFKAKLLGDAQTMAYNHAYGGTIPFPEARWGAWYERWIANPEGKRFYRYIRVGDTFVGEAACHFDDDRKIYLADVIVYAPFRGKGYGREALLLLCDTARKNGVTALYDDIAIDNPAAALFLACGFCEVGRTDECVTVKKDL